MWVRVVGGHPHTHWRKLRGAARCAPSAKRLGLGTSARGATSLAPSHPPTHPTLQPSHPSHHPSLLTLPPPHSITFTPSHPHIFPIPHSPTLPLSHHQTINFMKLRARSVADAQGIAGLGHAGLWRCRRPRHCRPQACDLHSHPSHPPTLPHSHNPSLPLSHPHTPTTPFSHPHTIQILTFSHSPTLPLSHSPTTRKLQSG